MSFLYSVRPLSDRAWVRTNAQRRWSVFQVGWSKALDILEFEVDQIGGKDVVIEIDVEPSALRLDGTLRARAQADSPAVIVAFDSRQGPLLFRSDLFAGNQWSSSKGMAEPWQHNVYAVALTLEALRGIDRWGAAKSGEQYRGYTQIGAGPAIVPDAPMTDERARELLWWAAYPQAEDRLSAADEPLDRIVRLAKRNTHPDTRLPGLADVTFTDVQRAAAHLRGGAA